MKHLIILLSVCLIGISSCTTPDESIFEFDLSTVYNQINFEKPAVGQVSTYLHFSGINFGQPNSSVTYTGDTLVVTLIAKSGNAYTFEEFISSGSPVFDVANPYIQGFDTIRTSNWQVVNDSLRLTEGSTFLDWNTEIAIPLEIGADLIKVSLRNWGTDNITNPGPYFGVTTGRINDFNYSDLTVSYLNITPSFVHANFYELIANRPFGIVRSSTFNDNTISGSGWDLQLGE